MGQSESIDMDELAEEEAKARGDFLEEEDVEDEEAEEEDDREPENEDDEGDEESDEGSSEETDEEEESDEDEEEDVEEEAPGRIPKYRLDEVISQRESEKERADWLQSQLENLLTPKSEAPKKAEYDYEEKESEYTVALIEGEAEKASKLRREIDRQRQVDTAALITQARDEALESAKTESQQQLDEDRFASLVEMYEEEYKFLKHGDEEYNEDAVDTVNALMAGHLAKGESKTASLKKAIKKAVGFYAKPKKVVGSSRKKDAVKRNVKADKSQPSRKMRGKKKDVEGDVDVSKLSDGQFRKLSRKERAELRGDFL